MSSSQGEMLPGINIWTAGKHEKSIQETEKTEAVNLYCHPRADGVMECEVIKTQLPSLPIHPIKQFPTVTAQPAEVIESVKLDEEGLRELQRNIRYTIPKYPPMSHEAELLNSTSKLILGILTGGVTEFLNPDTLYEVRSILKTKGFGKNVGALTTLASIMK